MFSDRFGEAVSFVGYYVSFPFEERNPEKWIRLMEDAISLEQSGTFRRADVIYTQSQRRGSVKLSDAKLGNLIARLASREFVSTRIYSTSERTPWTESLGNGVTLEIEASYIQPGKSAFSERFKVSGSFVATYPCSRFAQGTPSDFQTRLVTMARKSFRELSPSYAFVHMGIHPLYPFSVGSDYVYELTREGMPATAFDFDITGLGALYFREFVKGSFWANFLNPSHVASLGGIEAIQKARPCDVIEDLGEGRALLQVGPSPLPVSREDAAVDYQRLRRFMKPILLETAEDRTKLNEEILGRDEVERIHKEASQDKELRRILRRMR